MCEPTEKLDNSSVRIWYNGLFTWTVDRCSSCMEKFVLDPNESTSCKRAGHGHWRWFPNPILSPGNNTKAMYVKITKGLQRLANYTMYDSLSTFCSFGRAAKSTHIFKRTGRGSTLGSDYSRRWSDHTQNHTLEPPWETYEFGHSNKSHLR